MEALFDKTLSTFIPVDSDEIVNNYWDKNGKKAANINPEFAAPLLEVDNGNLTSSFSVDTDCMHTNYIADLVSLRVWDLIYIRILLFQKELK